MARKTRKYKLACALVGLDKESGIPNEDLYAVLQLNGYEWQDGRWVDTNEPPPRVEMKVRISGPRSHAEAWAEQFEHALEVAGMVDIRRTMPYSNRKTNHVRIYVEWKE